MRRFLFEVCDYENPDRRIGKFYGELDGVNITCVNYKNFPKNWFFRVLNTFVKVVMKYDLSVGGGFEKNSIPKDEYRLFHRPDGETVIILTKEKKDGDYHIEERPGRVP